jgi:hypothetical protein
MRLIVVHPCIRFPDPAFALAQVIDGEPCVYLRDGYLPRILPEGVAYSILDLAPVPPSRMSADSTVAAVVWEIEADRLRFFGWNPEASEWLEFHPASFRHPEPVQTLQPVQLSPEPSPEVQEGQQEP